MNFKKLPEDITKLVDLDISEDFINYIFLKNINYPTVSYEEYREILDKIYLSKIELDEMALLYIIKFGIENKYIYHLGIFLQKKFDNNERYNILLKTIEHSKDLDFDKIIQIIQIIPLNFFEDNFDKFIDYYLNLFPNQFFDYYKNLSFVFETTVISKILYKKGFYEIVKEKLKSITDYRDYVVDILNIIDDDEFIKDIFILKIELLITEKGDTSSINDLRRCFFNLLTKSTYEDDFYLIINNFIKN
ncbi:hypothetical protein JXR93_06780, partial [bacterium]|nr:hypothetical protein [bacterium]